MTLASRSPSVPGLNDTASTTTSAANSVQPRTGTTNPRLRRAVKNETATAITATTGAPYTSTPNRNSPGPSCRHGTSLQPARPITASNQSTTTSAAPGTVRSANIQFTQLRRRRSTEESITSLEDVFRWSAVDPNRAPRWVSTRCSLCLRRRRCAREIDHRRRRRTATSPAMDGTGPRVRAMRIPGGRRSTQLHRDAVVDTVDVGGRPRRTVGFAFLRPGPHGSGEGDLITGRGGDDDGVRIELGVAGDRVADALLGIRCQHPRAQSEKVAHVVHTPEVLHDTLSGPALTVPRHRTSEGHVVVLDLGLDRVGDIARPHQCAFDLLGDVVFGDPTCSSSDAR